MEFVFDLKVDHLSRALSAARRSIEQPDELLGSVGLSLVQINQDRHLAGRAPDGTPWDPLSPRTLARKKGRAILFEHGDMLRTGFFHQVHGNTLHVGSGDRKAPFHQFGVRPHAQKRGHHPGIPARPIIGFPASDAAVVANEARDYLQVILERAKGQS